MPDSRVSSHQSNGRAPDAPASPSRAANNGKAVQPPRSPAGIPIARPLLIPSKNGYLGGDPPPPPKRPRNHPTNLRRAAERRCDPIGFMLALAAAHPAQVDAQREFGRLARLVRRRALAEPECFVDEILDHGVAVVGLIHMRLAFQIGRLVERSDFGHGRDAGATLPREVTETLLPTLLQVDRYLADLSLTRASRDRQRALAHAKQVETAQAAGPTRSNTAAATHNGVAHPASLGKPTKAASGKARKPASTADRLSLTLACDQPSEEFEYARMANQIGFLEPIELGSSP